ncbi:MAG: S46 family peptidase [Myxococcaceae bacterium]|nr:S46 family peptidase [Myxococcaceae bacterium]
MSRSLKLAAVLSVLALPAFADEGMWLLNSFPAEAMKKKYGSAPTQDWLDHVRLSAVRLAGGCSASIVSETGLVMTNHHCVHSCVQDLSTPKQDFVKNGWFAKTQKDEKACPGMEINQLVEMTDVTKQVQEATKGVDDAKFNEVQKAKLAELEKACGTSDELRCEVISLYRGGRFELYKYRRFQDVRLVFAPEVAIAFFGGDPDNFNFPRYDLDSAFVRVYGKDGAPMKMDHYLKWSSELPKEDDLAFVVGNPGGTSRLLTVSQLEFDRDVKWPAGLTRLSELRGMLHEYAHRGAEQQRHSEDTLFYVENAIKAYKGRHQALADKAFFEGRVAAEKAFRAKIDANPELKKQYGGVWDSISATEEKARLLRKSYATLETTNSSELLGFARTLLRSGDELPKPNGERLKEFSDARLPQLKQSITKKAPIYDEFETMMLGWQLTKLREELGADNAVVKKIFGKQSPEALAAAAVKGTKLKDEKVRAALFEGGKAKIDAAKDPMIELARLYDADARAVRKQWEAEVEGPLKKQGELLAKANFALNGTSSYPDATFTQRISYGTIKGFKDDTGDYRPFTTLAGAFERHTGADPFALPKTWLDAKSKLLLETPFNLCTTNDIIGGNSGSPMVNAKGEVIGLVFDGNIHSLGGEYGFDEKLNRAVAVHSAAITEALEKIYGAKRLVDELRPAGAAKAGDK